MSTNQLSASGKSILDLRDEKWTATYKTTIDAFEYDSEGVGHLREGAKEPTADDLLVVLEADAATSVKTRARMATMLLFAKGKKVAGGKCAYEWLVEKMEAKFKGSNSFAFSNAKGLVPVIEFMQQEKLTGVSVYTVKDVIGYINKRDLRGSDGTVKEEHRDEPIVKMLLTDKKPLSEIKKQLTVERAKYEDLFPKREGSKKDADTEKEAKDEAQAALNSDTIEKIELSLQECKARIDAWRAKNAGKDGFSPKADQAVIAAVAKEIYILAGTPKLK